jgi:transposase
VEKTRVNQPDSGITIISARRLDVVPGQIYRWRRDLRTAAVGFAEVVVAPEPSERTVAESAT